jgi:uncharacterized membrane protein YozB (DUF420 family)
MPDVTDLPALNAILNATSAVCLLLGFIFIKRGDRKTHKTCMLGALVASALFLTSYVIYHAQAGSRPFPGQGPIRVVYFAILISHVVLAAVILPLAIVTTSRGLAGRFDRHRAIARWTFPLWMYVSLTGIVVYLMLYQMY